ncbi:hypothetical protein K2173_022734 [Erythroxylum novogranatense]|uniref:Uncharacterized protein n=1 Tax=Erythroxylum novogranatense TaxID=1862640 RepID=A0AAV8SMR8_9ROSI|nr:hypothetical protein K2173_022734 [Erythroxylum novogranatense]
MTVAWSGEDFENFKEEEPEEVNNVCFMVESRDDEVYYFDYDIEVDELRNAYHELYDQYKKIDSKCFKEIEKSKNNEASLKSKIKLLESVIENLTTKNMSLEDDYKQKVYENEVLEERLAKLENTLLENDYDKVRQLEEKVVALEQEKEKCVGKILPLEKDLAKFVNGRNNLDALLDQYKKLTMNCFKEIEKSKNNEASLKSKIKLLESVIENMTTKNMSLKDDYKQKVSEKEVLEERLAKLEITFLENDYDKVR